MFPQAEYLGNEASDIEEKIPASIKIISTLFHVSACKLILLSTKVKKLRFLNQRKF